MKNAQSMGMNVVIVAILALVVLAILIYVFTSKIKQTNNGLGTCNGYCLTDNDKGVCREGFVRTLQTNCNDGRNPIVSGQGTCCFRVNPKE